jgi:hypothetical protein
MSRHANNSAPNDSLEPSWPAKQPAARFVSSGNALMEQAKLPVFDPPGSRSCYQFQAGEFYAVGMSQVSG